MNFAKATVRGSPYVGVFCSATDEFVLVPHGAQPKELKTLEQKLEARAIRASIGNSGLLGVLSKGIGAKLAVSGLAEKQEIRTIEKEGIEVLVVEENYTATGNLLAMNSNGGVASPLFSDKAFSRLAKFFGIKLVKMTIAGSDLTGACLTVTNKGFIANPSISENEFANLENIFRAKGVASTANFGDLMVGNSIIANSKGIVVGEKTSGIELSRIDEAFRE